MSARSTPLLIQNADHKADRVVVIASGLDQPNGVALRNGALYVATASRLLRFDDIEKRPVDVLQMPDGSILISDDRGNRLIRVSYRR
jgi:glucose/arabinose dehydrogenase